VTPVALVTGAGGGIGGAVSRRLRAEGWQVVAVDRDPSADAGPGIEIVRADVADPAQTAAILRAAASLGRLDALVNNAASMLTKPLVETSLEEWDALMADNLRSAFLLMRGAYPLLRAARGSVVNVSSVHALATSRGVAAYATSKAALVGMTRALALELAPDGIRVNAVLPGAVETRMLREGLRRAGGEDRIQESLAQLAGRVPLARVGQPDDIAEAILFLVDSRRSAYVTGQAFVVDGGALAALSTE
jgi:NAD(P)-dependent dehydrogenase (short-subunit alcohol dehydrogenase family)